MSVQSSQLNTLKEDALQILLRTSFTHIQQMMREEQKEIAKKNAVLRNVNAFDFMYEGVVYPLIYEDGKTINRSIKPGMVVPPLHYSLIAELEASNKKIIDAGYHSMKNLFSAILTHSANGIVLDAVLPVQLVNVLKQHFSPQEYELLDKLPAPAMETRLSVDKIKHHYGDTIHALRNLMMDRLLLE